MYRLAYARLQSYKMCFAVLVLSLWAYPIRAQAVSGWTSLEWDAPSQTFYGYAETDLDDDAAIYYAAALNSWIFDQNGNVVASVATSRDTDESWADAEISAPGSGGQTFSQHSEHLAVIQYYGGDCAEPCRSPAYWTDFYNYLSFSDNGSDSFNYDSDMYLMGPGPEVDSHTEIPPLPPTTSSASATAPPVCGDQRDTIIGEYKSYHTGFSPQCTYFTSSGGSAYFSFNAYNYPSPGTAPATYSYAILTSELFSFVDYWNSIVYFNHINSGYRCPSQNADAGGVHNSQHMFGTAIDAQNASGSQQTWWNINSAAATAGADWIEPINGPCKLACVHGDVRNHTHTYIYP